MNEIKLNPEQQAAVDYRGQALLIVAGAGSGKTRVLTSRIASFIDSREAWPSQILAITFTNKAAAEMRERVEEQLGRAAEGMWISTFHSACVRILRKEAERFGYGSGFTIYDTADSRALLKRIIKELEVDVHGFTPANTGAKISRLKNELKDAETYSGVADTSNPKEQHFIKIFKQYEDEMKKARAFDFDDLISQTVFLLRAFPEIAAIYRRKFRHIFIDEYQDTNHAQYALVRELTKPVAAEHNEGKELQAATLTVVGDSDQSIYAFRGADIRNIVEFERDFHPAKVIKLEQNYRSTQNVLDAANAVISNNAERQDKKLWSDRGAGDEIVGFTGYSQHDEARFIAERVGDLHDDGKAYSDIAVLYRTNAQTRALEELLIREAIPYRVLGGTKFYERAEIKDALAYLVSIANPYEPISWSRLLGAPKRGIGPMTETRLAMYATDRDISFHQAMLEAENLQFGPKVLDAVKKLGAFLTECSQYVLENEKASVAELLKRVYEESQMIAKLREKHDPQDEARAENLEELLAVAKEFDEKEEGEGLLDFLTEVSLVAAADDLDDQSGTVSLMTLHTAKGLEYDTVFLTGLEEGIIPHQMSVNEPGGIAEERRLMYVGITRAKKKLFLTLASSRAQFGDVSISAPSRFLEEIPPHLIAWEEAPNKRVQTHSSAATALPAREGENMKSALDAWRERKKQAKADFPNLLGSTVANNSDLELKPGDRIRHESYGEGRVTAVTGAGSKTVAFVSFTEVGEKKLVVKLAPIKKVTD